MSILDQKVNRQRDQKQNQQARAFQQTLAETLEERKQDKTEPEARVQAETTGTNCYRFAHEEEATVCRLMTDWCKHGVEQWSRSPSLAGSEGSQKGWSRPYEGSQR